jgi:hypothetical protein
VTRYAIRRVALAIEVVAGVVILTFVIADLVPGDPAVAWAGPHASAAQLARARQYLGLDQSLPVRIGKYFGGILTGNWGTSIHTHQPVLSDIGTAAPATPMPFPASPTASPAYWPPQAADNPHTGWRPDLLMCGRLERCLQPPSGHGCDEVTGRAGLSAGRLAGGIMR